MKKRDLFIVLIVLAFGIVYNYVESGEIQFYEGCSIDNRGLRDRGHLNTFQRDGFNYAPGEIATLDIDNIAGSIRVNAGESGIEPSEIRVVPEVQVFHRDKERAADFAKDIKITATMVGSKAVFSVKPSPSDFPYTRVRVLFNVSIPKNAELSLNLWNRYGDVDVEKMNTLMPMTVDNKHGNIVVKQTQSPLRIQHKHGKLTLREVANRVEFDSRYSRVSVNRVKSLSISGSHANMFVDGVEGNTLVDSLSYSSFKIEKGGNLNFSGRHTRVKAINLQKGVKLVDSHSSVYLEDIAGDVDIDTKQCRLSMDNIEGSKIMIRNSYDDVRIHDITTDKMEIHLRHGNLDIDIRSIKEQMMVDNQYSRIRLYLPEEIDPAFNIDLNHGKLTNTTRTSLDVATRKQGVQAINEARGPRITIKGYYGDLYLKPTKLVPKTSTPQASPDENKINVEPEEFTKPTSN